MQETILSNGLKVVYYPMKNAFSVAVGLYIKAGSRYENLDNNGITHFLEHLHFRQLAGMKQNEIYYNMEKIGSSLRGTTHKNILSFCMKVRPLFFRESLTFFKKILITDSWDEEDLKLEKKIILREIDEKSDYVDSNGIVARAVWGENSLAFPIVGSSENVERFTLEEVINYKKNVFTNKNVYMIVTGAISEREISLVSDMFDDIVLGTNHQLPAEISFRERTPDVVIAHYDWNCVDVTVSFDIILSHVSHEKVMLLNSIIGGGTGSLLQLQVREKHGLSYNVFSEVEMHGDVATINISFTTGKREFYSCIEIIMQVLKSAKKDIDNKCMEVNKPFFSENLWFWLENPEMLNRELMWQGCLKDDKGFAIEAKIRDYEKLSIDDMKWAAQEIFKPEKTAIVIIGNAKGITKKRIREIVRINLQ